MSEDRCKCGAPVSKNEAAFYACGSPIKPRHDVYPHSSECYERQLSRQAQEIERLKHRLEVMPDSGTDGIFCRDETIKLQDQEIAQLREVVEAFKYLINYPPNSKEHQDAEQKLKDLGEI